MEKLQNIWSAECLHFILLFQGKLGCFLRDLNCEEGYLLGTEVEGKELLQELQYPFLLFKLPGS